jgi:hypothetical protein
MAARLAARPVLGIVIRPRGFEAFVERDRGPPADGRSEPRAETDSRSVIEMRSPAGPERRRLMSETYTLQVDAIGVVPTLMLVLVMLLTALGVVAHAASL